MGSESDVPLRSAFNIDSSKGYYNNDDTTKGFISMDNLQRRGWHRSSKGFFKLGQSWRGGKTATQVYDDDIPTDKSWSYLDPSSQSLHRWNAFFLASCLVAVFIDPLFFYLPQVDFSRSCISISRDLKIAVTVVRTLTDFFLCRSHVPSLSDRVHSTLHSLLRPRGACYESESHRCQILQARLLDRSSRRPASPSGTHSCNWSHSSFVFLGLGDSEWEFLRRW